MANIHGLGLDFFWGVGYNIDEGGNKKSRRNQITSTDRSQTEQFFYNRIVVDEQVDSPKHRISQKGIDMKTKETVWTIMDNIQTEDELTVTEGGQDGDNEYFFVTDSNGRKFKVTVQAE
jgi:hypothetical protein